MPSRADMERAVWAAAHRDSKSLVSGVRHVMYLEPSGAAKLVPLSSLSIGHLGQMYDYAERMLGRSPKKSYQPVSYDVVVVYRAAGAFDKARAEGLALHLTKLEVDQFCRESFASDPTVVRIEFREQAGYRRASGGKNFTRFPKGSLQL